MSNNNISNTINKVETTTKINNLLQQKYEIHSKIQKYKELIKTLLINVDNITNELFKICKHEWHDEEFHAVNEKPDKICDICGSRIVRF